MNIKQLNINIKIPEKGKIGSYLHSSTLSSAKLIHRQPFISVSGTSTIRKLKNLKNSA